MSEARKELAEAIERATLERQLSQMSLESDDPLSLLGSLAAALFPSGPPQRDRLTWMEQGTSVAGASPALDAEAKLATAELRYRTLVEQIPAVTFLAVLGEGKNEIYVSPHIEQMLGFSQTEWLEAPFLWYWQLHPEDRQLLNDEFARGCRTGGPFKAECRFLARDGHVVWVHGEARLVKDALGRPSMLQGVAFDITDSKRAALLLLDKALRDAKTKEELAIAHRMQTSILPKKFDVSGLEIATSMVAAEEVGGDYYDVLPVEGGAWIGIGDVSGHGLDSGLIMLMAQSGMAALVRANPNASPAELIIALNDVLYENIRTRLHHDDHVTFALLRFFHDGRIGYAGAHEDILVCRKASGRVECIETSGTWLGARKGIGDVTRDELIKLLPGDVVVLYTHGITEAMNATNAQFELSRVITAVEEASGKSCIEIRDHVIASARAWMSRQDDDMTIVVFRYHGEGVAAKVIAPAATAAVATKISARPLTAISLFDPPELVEQAPELALESLADRLSADGVLGGSGLRLRLKGVAETPDREDVQRLPSAAHTLAIARKVEVLELDLRALEFLNSTCFKELLTWLTSVRALPSAQRYRVRFVTNPFTRWQRASVHALLSFAHELVDVENRSKK